MPGTAWKPLDAETWDDFESLFGPRGATGGCWCMWYRLTHRDYEASKGEGNRQKMHALACSGARSPGVLLYVDGKVSGWCAVAPRKDYVRLETSRIMKPVDDAEVWSIMCFFVRKEARRTGLGVDLVQAALGFAESEGAKMVEAYPVEPRKDSMPPVFASTGIRSVFDAAGFAEVARRSESRPIMRYDLRG